jgi:signal peptidase I
MNINEKIKSDRQEARGRRAAILVGDVVQFSDGSRNVVAHVWEKDYVQFGHGSIYILPSGDGEYSGGLTLGVKGKYTRTDKTSLVEMWFFDQDWPRANSAITSLFKVAVWSVDQLPPKG